MKTYSRKQINTIRFIRDELLRVPLWGTLYISMDLDRPAIIDAVALIRKHKPFRKYGFNVELIDGMDFVQKIPDFWDNEKLIENHDLKLFNRANYQRYLSFMHNEMLKYQKQKR